MIEIVKTTKLPKVLSTKVDPKLLSQAVRVYLGNQRTAAAKTKTRGEVNKTTAKMFRQKGTGRARHGTASAPIFVGGGVSHGPDGSQNFSGKLTKSFKKTAVVGALSAKAAAKKLTVISGANTAKGKTKEVAEIIPTKSLVITTPEQVKFARACKNLDRVDVMYANQLNAYAIISHANLVISEEALENLSKIYA